MFSKPANFKPFAAIKNSERKNVLAKIEKQCSLEDLTTEQKQLLLPKTVQSANALSHAQDKIVIYSEDQLPLWIVYKSQYVPTVALVGRLPVDMQLKLLPAVYTVPRTLQYLQNGADFMTPGIFGDLPTSPVQKGTPVQIRDLESQSVIATGLALRDLSQITEADTGKCVQTISVVGDKLTPKTRLVDNTAAAAAAATVARTGEAVPPTADAAATNEPLAEEGPAAPVAEPEAPKDQLTTSVDLLTLAEEENDDGDSDQTGDDGLTPKEAEQAFMCSLNIVIRQAKHTYPMTMAAFAALLHENLPFEHPQLNIKNTPFKKMGKLLKHAEKLGLINTRDRQGGEVIVMSSNVPPDESESAAQEKKFKTAQKKPNNNANRMVGMVLYKPKPSTRKIMDESAANIDLHDAASLRKQLLQYITKHTLITEDRAVNLDDALRSALGLRQNVTTVKLEEIGPLAVKQSTPYHKIVSPGQNPNSVNWSKGGVPTIAIKTERRGGNKTVTLVQTAGLEGFSIDPQELADELRHACAGSSTITDVKGFKCIVVQGNHVDKIIKVLEKRGIRPSWVKTTNK